MNTITRKQWIEALKSGKYKQTRKVLGNTEGHCCLGVACEVAGYEKSLSEDSTYLYKMPYGDGEYISHTAVLTVQVAEDLRLTQELFSIPRELADNFGVVCSSGWTL